MKLSRGLLLLIALLSACSAYDIHTASKPRHQAASAPEKIFESFWQTFEDQYAFFELHQVDWHASYKKFRPRVSAATSNDSLFSILSAMVKPLNDDHVSIYSIHKKVVREFTAEKPSRFLSEFPDEASEKNFWNMVGQTLQQNGFDELKSSGPKEDGVPLFQYCKSGTTGYIRFTRCYVNSLTENNELKDAAQVDTFLKPVMVALKDSEQIILDVRSNEGGNDFFSQTVAAWFTDKKLPVFYKQSRSGGYNDFSPLKTAYSEPKESPFKHPVCVLTNDQTASAAEVFAMIMKARPDTKLIGENSTGIYSDLYIFKLAPGWYASLSNERYFSHDMKCYEGTGTPVDVLIKNSRNDLVTLQDPVLMEALRH